MVGPPNPDSANNASIDIVVPANIPASSVSRRYSDFLWLYDRLQSDRPGAVVPPLPEKQPVGRFSPSFVEDRRIHLERFLRRVAVHPELQDCSCLDLFLSSNDMTFQATKQIKVTAMNMSGSTATGSFMPHQHQPFGQPSSTVKKEGIKRWFAETKTSMTGDLVKSPDDDLFEEIQRYVNGLDNQMRNVSQQASGLVRKGKEIANGLFEFGLAFNLLGQSEADALGGALLCMGETADKLSVLAAEQAEREMAQFEEPLQDYIKTINAVKLALQRRHEKRVTYSTCLADTESKQQQFYKLRSQLGSEAKAYSLELSSRRAQEAADLARDDFCACSQRVLREVDRFKREKAEDMRRTVLDYINLQVEYNKRMEEIWSTLIPELEKVPPLDSPLIISSGSAINNPITVSPESAILQPQPALYYGQPPPPVPQFDATQQPPAPHGNNAPPINDPSSLISVQYRETPGL
jgi:sorting nexin-1/2